MIVRSIENIWEYIVRILRTSCLVVLFVASHVSAGVVFEIETKDHVSSDSGTVQAFVEGKNLKMLISSGDNLDSNEMIFRGESREMVVVDHDDRSYMVIDEAMISSIGEQLSGVEAQMLEALKNVPPEQRAMMEKMMKGRMPPQAASPVRARVELQRTGESGDKNGYPCVKYEATLNGRTVREMWVTPWDNVEGGDEAAEAFEEMAEFFAEMRDSMPKFGGDEDENDNPFESMKEMNGFPVLSYEIAADGSISSESALNSSTRRTLDPDEFEPPSGYKRRQMMPH